MTRSYTTKDGYTPSELICAARDHLLAADVLFRYSFRCFDSAGYLGHLSLELATKAALLELREEFPNSHDLPKPFRILHDACGLELTEAGHQIVEQLNGFSSLRYPELQSPEIGSEDWPNIEDAFGQLVTCVPELKAHLDNRDPTKKAGRILMTMRIGTEESTK